MRSQAKAGIDRLTGEEFHGSARIALEDRTKPAASRVSLLRARRQAGQGLQDGSSRATPAETSRSMAATATSGFRGARRLRRLNWAPTSAFLDPDGMELAWEPSLPSLITSAATGRKLEKPEYKVELWMLFPTRGLVRTLALDEDEVPPPMKSSDPSLRQRGVAGDRRAPSRGQDVRV